jgi:hypothetical protein
MKTMKIKKNLSSAKLLTKLTFGLLLLTITTINAQIKLSESAKVSLVTFGSGQELYSAFGHTGVWVYDPTLAIDRVYSWGSFDFNTNNFYVKFLRGTLPYQISVIDFGTMANYYSTRENRSVTEQILNLSANQKQKIFDLAEENYKPENREYRYKFYYDNCATRVRDILQKGCGDSLKYWQSKEKISYRTWMNSYLNQKPWARMAMNAAIGVPADAMASSDQSMYLPDNVMIIAEKSKIGKMPMVAKKIEHYKQTPIEESGFSWLWHPQLLINLIYLGLFIFLYKTSRNTVTKLDKYLIGFSGFLGVFLLFLWFGTDHGVTNQNLHLFVLLPTNLLIVWLLGKPKFRFILQNYVWVLLAGVLAFILFHPQHSVPMGIYLFNLFRYRDLQKGFA